MKREALAITCFIKKRSDFSHWALLGEFPGSVLWGFRVRTLNWLPLPSLPSGTRISRGRGIMGRLSLRSTMITVRVAEPASRGVPLSVAVTTSLVPQNENQHLNLIWTLLHDVYFHLTYWVQNLKKWSAIMRKNNLNSNPAHLKNNFWSCMINGL